MHIILGSQSPRRKELLNQIGVKFECIVSDGEEIITKTAPNDIVKELSYHKAVDVKYKLPEGLKDNYIIIGADTIVSFDNKILGKPVDNNDAFRTLKFLSGNVHQVYTGVTIIYNDGDEKTITFSECTDVYVENISDKEIIRYVNSGEPLDKAGSYGIQGSFAIHIKKIDGDYNNVVGLPVARLYKEIKNNFGIDIVKLSSLENELEKK